MDNLPIPPPPPTSSTSLIPLVQPDTSYVQKKFSLQTILVFVGLIALIFVCIGGYIFFKMKYTSSSAIINTFFNKITTGSGSASPEDTNNIGNGSDLTNISGVSLEDNKLYLGEYNKCEVVFIKESSPNYSAENKVLIRFLNSYGDCKKYKDQSIVDFTEIRNTVVLLSVDGRLDGFCSFGDKDILNDQANDESFYVSINYYLSEDRGENNSLYEIIRSPKEGYQVDLLLQRQHTDKIAVFEDFNGCTQIEGKFEDMVSDGNEPPGYHEYEYLLLSAYGCDDCSTPLVHAYAILNVDTKKTQFIGSDYSLTDLAIDLRNKTISYKEKIYRGKMPCTYDKDGKDCFYGEKLIYDIGKTVTKKLEV